MTNDIGKAAQTANTSGPAPDSVMGGAVFSDLIAFGLEDAVFSNIYGAAAETSQGEHVEASQMKEIEKGLYFKSFKCPICDKEVKIPAIRSSAVRLVQTESDFMPVYKDPNPLYYFVDFCKECGFAAMPATVKTINAKQKKQIREKISAKWKFTKQYPVYYDPNTAIEIHKLALYNAIVAGEKESVRSILCLHIAWLYRILKDEENEKIFMNTAREGFERAYAVETEPIGGMDKSSQQYLVGELLKRTGNMTGALEWFKLVLIDRNANPRVKEMARNQKDRITAFFASGGKFQ